MSLRKQQMIGPSGLLSVRPCDCGKQRPGISIHDKNTWICDDLCTNKCRHFLHALSVSVESIHLSDFGDQVCPTETLLSGPLRWKMVLRTPTKHPGKEWESCPHQLRTRRTRTWKLILKIPKIPAWCSLTINPSPWASRPDTT